MAEARKTGATGGLRFIELDGLRGMATALVVCAHISFAPLFWAWMLMDMFFVMSSFLLTHIALKKVHGGPDILSFYRRRIERIWPLYFLVVWAVFLLTVAIADSSDAVRVFWRYFSFSHYSEYNFSSAASYEYAPYLHHLWSIAIEEQFYILLPWFVFLLRRAPAPVWVLVLGAVAAAGILLRSVQSNMWVLGNHLDAFVAGGLMAAAIPLMTAEARASTLVSVVLMVAGLAGFLPYVVDGYRDFFAGRPPPGFNPLAAFAAIVFWSGTIIYFATHRGARHLSAMRLAPLVYMGKISYAIYLVHYPVFRLLPKGLAALSQATGLPQPGRPLTVLVALVLSFAIAHVLYEWIDRQLQSAGHAPPVPARS